MDVQLNDKLMNRITNETELLSQVQQYIKKRRYSFIQDTSIVHYLRLVWDGHMLSGRMYPIPNDQCAMIIPKFRKDDESYANGAIVYIHIVTPYTHIHNRICIS